MRSFFAALRSLVIPAGATNTQRIVLDGVTGQIVIYDNNNNERIVLDSQLISTVAEVIFGTGYAGETTGGGVGLIAPTINSERARMFLDSPTFGGAGGEAAVLCNSGSPDGTKDAFVQMEGTGATSLCDATDLPGGMIVKEAKYGVYVAENSYPTIEAWTAVTGGVGFTAPYLDFGGTQAPLKFRRNALNHVELYGVIKASGAVAAGSSTICTLPAGYRPDTVHQWGYVYGSAATAYMGTLAIDTAGAVKASNYAGTPTPSIIGIGISFPLTRP